MKHVVRPLKSQAGFSLIELMIVVAIIGILATIAVPNFQKFQSKSRMTEGKGYLAAIYSGEQSFYAEWNSYADCLDGIGVIKGGGGQTFQGAGVYTAGFMTSGSVIPTGVAAASCQQGKATAATAAGGVPFGVLTASTIATALFTAQAAGNIGGAADDLWTLDNTNKMTWTQSGL